MASLPLRTKHFPRERIPVPCATEEGVTLQIHGEPKISSSWLPGSPTAVPVLPRPSPRACTVQAFPADPKFPSHVLWRETAQHCSAFLAPLGQAIGVSAGDLFTEMISPAKS